MPIYATQTALTVEVNPEAGEVSEAVDWRIAQTVGAAVPAIVNAIIQADRS